LTGSFDADLFIRIDELISRQSNKLNQINSIGFLQDDYFIDSHILERNA